MAPPKGNKNALKHGFYEKRISKDEQELLDGQGLTDLTGEIRYMRVVIGRIAGILEKNGLANGDTKELTDQTIKTTHTLNAAMSTLINCVTQYALLTGELHEFEKQIEEGKFLARERLGVYQYLTPAKKPAKRR